MAFTPNANSKKRPAPTSGGPGGGAKKGRFDPKDNKQSSNPGGTGKPSFPKNKGKAAVRTQTRGGNGKEKVEEIKRRKMPLTSSKTEDDEEEDEDMEGDEDEDEEDLDIEMEDVSKPARSGQPSTGADGEHKRLSKAEREALHAAQPHRTSLLPSHPLLKDIVLPLWESARKADLTPEERKAAIKELWMALKGRVAEISKGHKGGRVLQTLVKFGDKEVRGGVVGELAGQYKGLISSKYSKFLMGAIIKYCPTARPTIITELTPSISSLLFHSHACKVISDFYELYASSKEKRLMVRGFYPKEVIIFEEVAAAAATEGKGEGQQVPGLEKVLEGMKEGKGRERVLEELAEKIVHVFNSTQKEALSQAIFHRLVLEYLTCVYKFLSAEDADLKMHALLEASLESLADILHTRDGASVVREFLARGTAKDRKNVLRVLKPHLQKVCEDAEAQMVLFTAFDCVDDTKMMGKAIIAEIATLMPTLALHKTGRRVLLYLLVPRSTKYFIPSTNDLLALSDVSAAATSKKATATRREELKAAASEGLVKLVESHAEEMLRDAGASLLLSEIMLFANGSKDTAADAILAPLLTPYPSPPTVDPNPDPTTADVLDLAYGGRAYKTLLSGGHFSTATKTVDVRDQAARVTFARRFWKTITSDEAGGSENAVHIAVGNTPFLLIEMIEALKGEEDVMAEVRRVLGVKEVKGRVASSVRKGAGLLAERLESL